MKCLRCKAVSASDVLFCRNCGILFHGDAGVECENHSGRDAVSICVVCGKPLCGDCARVSEGKTYCNEPPHSQLPVTHAKLGAAVSEFGADLVASNLSSNGIDALIFSQHRYSHFYRFTDDAPASIYVEKDKTESARQLIKEMDLADFLQKIKKTL